jgi:hypothetical protein
LGSSAVIALMALTMSVPSLAADSNPRNGTSAPTSKAREPVPADDVPAPPMALLFGIGAIGLIWGRRLAASAREKRESAKPD